MKSVKIIVSGRVQGVYFRVFTKKKAEALGLTGYVKNKNNGDVEIGANGSEKALEELATWCHKGSPFSNVTGVEVTNIDDFSKTGSFDITY